MIATPLPPPPAPPGLASGLPAADRRAPGPDAGTLAVASAALRGGFVLLPRTLLHAPGLSRDAKLLYAVLLSYAWQAGRCFPGYARLQADLGCGINQVTKYLRELEGAGLVTRRRRGLGKTTLYTLHDPPAPPTVEPARPSPDQERSLIHRFGESGVTEPVKAVSPDRRHKEDSEDQDPAEHHPARTTVPSLPMPPPTLAPTTPRTQEPTGANDDDALQLLVSQGVTRRIAQELVQTHSAEAIRQQLAWQAYRPPAKSPAGAPVRAIRWVTPWASKSLRASSSSSAAAAAAPDDSWLGTVMGASEGGAC